MNDEPWRPLGAEDSPEFDGLHDGMTPWLAPSFWAWVRGQFSRSEFRMTVFDSDLMHQAERVLHFSVGYMGVALGTGMARLQQVVTQEGQELRLADFLLATRGRYAQPEQVRAMLEEAGSLYTVGTRAGKPGLLKRVETGVQIAAEDTMASSGHAGERLAQAWTAAFGLIPDPSRAYSLAIKAVEDAAIPVVEPRNASATLGTVIRRMQSVPFRFDVPRELGGVTSEDVLLSMLRVLWNGQGDRHGGLPDASFVIAQQQGENAVVLAVTLVRLFASGAVAQQT